MLTMPIKNGHESEVLYPREIRYDKVVIFAFGLGFSFGNSCLLYRRHLIYNLRKWSNFSVKARIRFRTIQMLFKSFKWKHNRLLPRFANRSTTNYSLQRFCRFIMLHCFSKVKAYCAGDDHSDMVGIFSLGNLISSVIFNDYLLYLIKKLSITSVNLVYEYSP